MSKLKIHYSSNTNEYKTPKWLFDKLNKIYNFSYDLASNKNNTLCKNFFTKEENSLIQDWYKLKGWLWCNPPYSRQLLKLFYKKADEETQKGAKIIMLVPARTDTLYFHKYAYKKYEIEFLKGRLRFNNINNAPFPSMIIKFIKSDLNE